MSDKNSYLPPSASSNKRSDYAKMVSSEQKQGFTSINNEYEVEEVETKRKGKHNHKLGAAVNEETSYENGESIKSEEDIDLVGKELVTIDQAFELCGGFGRFQKINATVLIMTMVLSQCFLYSFPFLEVEPKY